MKNMVLLIDTNVILDYYLERGEFFADARETLAFCAEDEVQGCVAFHSLPNLWYILRSRPEAERRKMLRNLCSLLTVVSASHEEVLHAINATNFRDFEDCLQDQCAAEAHADYIVTRNVEDFRNAETEVITPAELCQIMKNT